ncbi:MAG TPA: trypsin-like peptidase domain-containing protein [Thermoanaerobaculia bacterium]
MDSESHATDPQGPQSPQSPQPHPARRRQIAALVLIAAGTVFGFVLASGLSTTPSGWAQGDDGGPVTIPSVAGSLPDFAELAEAIRPAVVAIEATRVERESEREGVDPFDLFFGPREGDPDGDRPGRGPVPQRSTGSGFVVSSDGLVVTNNHVIEGADRVRVILEGRHYDAHVQGIDTATDVALLKLDVGRRLPYLELGDSDALRVGEWVMVVGSPLQLDQTVTVGVVSAKGRSLGVLDTSFEDFIQTDAAINFGNSGGPMVDLQGRVVGIATLINWGAENIGFAVPVKTLAQILPQLRDRGEVRRGYLGVVIEDLDYEGADAYGLEPGEGVLVTQVVAGAPGAEAGLEYGDVVLRVDDRAVSTTRELIDYVSARGPGARVALDVLREGEEQRLTVRLTERPGEGAARDDEEAPSQSGIDWLGIRYQDLTPGNRQTHGIPADVDGVWITQIWPESPLWDQGVTNDGVLYVLTEVDGEPVTSVAELEAAIESAPDGSRLRLYIRRYVGGQEAAPLFVFPKKPE